MIVKSTFLCIAFATRLIVSSTTDDYWIVTPEAKRQKTDDRDKGSTVFFPVTDDSEMEPVLGNVVTPDNLAVFDTAREKELVVAEVAPKASNVAAATNIAGD